MTQLSIDFDAPERMARKSDPLTCFQAAQDARQHASRGRMLVLEALASSYAGMTDFDLARVTGWQQTSIGKRRGECVDAGWVEVATVEGIKVKRQSPSGSMALVWRIMPAGRQFLEAQK